MGQASGTERPWARADHKKKRTGLGRTDKRDGNHVLRYQTLEALLLYCTTVRKLPPPNSISSHLFCWPGPKAGSEAGRAAGLTRNVGVLRRKFHDDGDDDDDDHDDGARIGCNHHKWTEIPLEATLPAICSFTSFFFISPSRSRFSTSHVVIDFHLGISTVSLPLHGAMV